MLRLLKNENAYNTDSPRPSVNPKWPQLFGGFIVCLIHTGCGNKVVGSNLNKCYPEHDNEVSPLFESMYAIGEAPELIAIDLMRLL